MAIAPRDEPVDEHGARVGVENAREDLERGRLARAVRSDERDALTALDAQRHAVDGANGPRSRREQIGDARAKSGPARDARAKRLAEIVQLDSRSGHGDLDE